AGADIGALAGIVLVFAGERPLGRLLAQHGVLHRRQFLAPLGLALADLAVGLGIGHGNSLGLIVIARSEATKQSIFPLAAAWIASAELVIRRGFAPTGWLAMTGSIASVGDLGAAHQRRLLDVVLREDLLQVLDLRDIVIRNIGLVRVQRQIVLVVALRRI